MYDGAINFVKTLKKSIEINDPAQKGVYVRKTYDIIHELSISLDLKQGGDVAAKLRDLYQFINRQLVLVNIKSDLKAIETILSILTTLRAGWEQVINQQTNAPTDASTPPPTPTKSIASHC